MTRQAIVLAGGLGMRLRSAVPDLPKILAPVAGRPFIAYVLELLNHNGFSRVVLAVGYRRDLVMAALGDRFGDLPLDYAVEETPLGTGGAVWQATARLDAPDVFVLNGDTFVDAPFAALERAMEGTAVDVAMTVCRVADAGRFGSVDIENGQVRGFREKGAAGSGLVNAGVLRMRRDLADRFPLAGPFSLETDFLQRHLPALAIAAVPAEGDFLDIGVPEDYARAATVLPRLRRSRDMAENPRP